MKIKQSLIIVFLIGAIISGLLYLQSHRKYFEKEYKRYTLERKATAALSDFTNFCLSEFPASTRTDEIKSLRHCINIYSDWRYPPGTNLPEGEKQGQWLMAYAKGERDTPPPMECYYRSTALKRMLKTRGINSSLITLIRGKDNYPTHVILNVKNSENPARHEIHDPTYDVSFHGPEKTHPLPLKDMLIGNLDDIHPCNFEGECGWDLARADDLTLAQNKSYWEAAYHHDAKTLHYAPDRISLEQTYLLHGNHYNFCEAFTGWCKNMRPAR